MDESSQGVGGEVCCRAEGRGSSRSTSHIHEFSHGCLRHSPAVALSEVSNASMGLRKSLKARASSSGHSYFSVSTSNMPQGRSLVICFRSPEERGGGKR